MAMTLNGTFQVHRSQELLGSDLKRNTRISQCDADLLPTGRTTTASSIPWFLHTGSCDAIESDTSDCYLLGESCTHQSSIMWRIGFRLLQGECPLKKDTNVSFVLSRCNKSQKDRNYTHHDAFGKLTWVST